MLWLTRELKKEIRKVFEPRYKKNLTDEEIVEIANNLTELTKALLIFYWKQQDGKNI